MGNLVTKIGTVEIYTKDNKIVVSNSPSNVLINYITTIPFNQAQGEISTENIKSHEHICLDECSKIFVKLTFSSQEYTGTVSDPFVAQALGNLLIYRSKTCSCTSVPLCLMNSSIDANKIVTLELMGRMEKNIDVHHTKFKVCVTFNFGSPTISKTSVAVATNAVENTVEDVSVEVPEKVVCKV